MKKVRAVARIQLVVEVEAGVWGGDCPISQVYDQAAREAKEKIENGRIKPYEAKVVAEPRVITVMAEVDS